MAGDKSSYVQRLVDKLQPKEIEEQQSQSPTPQQYWIGIAGGPRLGKTKVAHALANHLNAVEEDSTLVISTDVATFDAVCGATRLGQTQWVPLSSQI